MQEQTGIDTSTHRVDEIVEEIIQHIESTSTD